MKKIYIFFLFFIVFYSLSYSQDIHFSQFFNNPLNVNPASTAFSENKYRLFLNHRNQWSSVTVPYTTYSAATDIQLIKRKYQNDIIGLGLIFNSDKAGDSEFGTNSAGISASYIKSFGKSGRNIIALGANYTYVQRSINYSKLTFDNQFNGNIFIPQLGSGESFNIENFSYSDFSLGLKWHYSISTETLMEIGIASWHINKPLQSFLNDESVLLPMRNVAHLSMDFQVSTTQVINPNVMYASQGPWQELMFGVNYKKILNQRMKEYKAMTFGIYYRNQDAFYIFYALDYKFMTFAASYDFNVSTLRPASSYRGGMEFSFIINFTKEKRRRIKQMKCPVF